MKIYHNPRCTKSRQALALLQENGAEPEIIEYLKTPPSAKELKSVVNQLGLSASDLVRTKEAKDSGLNLSEMSDSQIIAAMAEHPKIIQRPIVVHGNKAAIGRPPENVLELL